MAVGSFTLLIISPLSVMTENGRTYTTIDLWARDLAAQKQVAKRVCVVCPLGDPSEGHYVPVPDGVQIVTYDQVSTKDQLRALVSRYDVVQVGAGMPSWRANIMLAAATAARECERCLILGVSSNRAKTAILNARHRRLHKRVKARIVAYSIVRTQDQLVKMADGVFLVGHGLKLNHHHPNIHFETASWIRRRDVVSDIELREKVVARLRGPRLSLCVASRLESMKGVHLAIEASRLLREKMGVNSPLLTILGDGPEQQQLESLVSDYRLDDQVSFVGTLSYPEQFYGELSKHAVILLTNLNDEQPRVLFDAAVQGIVPICPDSEPYRALSLDRRLFYRRGSAESLANAVETYADRTQIQELLPFLLQLVHHNSIESMHEQRAAWMQVTLDKKRMSGKAGAARLNPH